MRIRKKKRVGLLIAAAVALLAAWWWSMPGKGTPQIITLPNGDRYQFAGVTYGRKNTPPSLLAHLVSWLPQQWKWEAPKYFGEGAEWYNQNEAIQTPCLFVWFRRLKTNAPDTNGSVSVTGFLADETGVEGGVIDYPAFSSGVGWSYVKCQAVPRRSRVLHCDLYPFGASTSSSLIGRVTFPNPVYGKFSQWQPETVPAVKAAGDLEVRLEHFATGVEESGTPASLAHGKQGGNYRQGTPGENVHTFFDVWVNSKGGTNWVTQRAELSDATGNVITSPLYVSMGSDGASPMLFVGDYRMAVPGTLWPDEAAWKLKLELKRKSGFDAAELVTFRNVPVPKMGTTNTTRITNSVGGVKLVMFEFGRNPTNSIWTRTPETLVSVEVAGPPAGMAVDLVKATTDKGDQLAITCNCWWDTERSLCLSAIPTNARTVDFTWAVQKMRAVEFSVKPPVAR